MRILWVNESASFIGGCEAYIFNTAVHLRAQGIVSLLLYDPLLPVDEGFLSAFEGAFPLVDLSLQLEEIPHDLVYLHQLGKVNQLVKLAQAKAPVIKFFHDHQLFCLRGDKLPYFSNQPCEKPAGCRCYPLGCTPVRRKNFLGIGISWLWQLRRAQKVHRQFDGYMTASKFMASEVALNGFLQEKIRTIPLYPFTAGKTDIELPRKPRELLFVGQLIRSKGLDVLLQAMSQLPITYTLTIVGDGRQGTYYRELAVSLKIDDRVSFLGRLPQPDIAPHYRQCSCVVVPSRWPEPFGLVGLEAMQFGAPVVACKIGGIPEWLVDGKNGYLVDPNDPDAIAQAVMGICEDNSLAHGMGEYGFKVVKEKFCVEKHCQQLMRYFREKIVHEIPESQDPLQEEQEIPTPRRKQLKTEPQECPSCGVAEGSWGRFTISGSDQLERHLTDLAGEIRDLIASNFSQSWYRAVLVIGSYGKGEGGVEFREGQEFPHNNLDILFIMRNGLIIRPEKLKTMLDQLLIPLTEAYEIGFDTSFVSEQNLKSRDSTLLWYEMFHGHKCLLGDSQFAKELSLGDLNNVPMREIQALMVNRGTLLIINDCILRSHPRPSEKLKRLLIKHIMKAVIGFGDAALYYLNDYHWSYKVRREHFLTNKEIPKDFRELYDKASTFRFQPNYDAYLTKDLPAWLVKMRAQLERVYLECEAFRLDERNLQADDCVEKALESVWREKPGSFKQWAKSWKGLAHPTLQLVGSSLDAKFAFISLSRSQRLAAIYPLIAFGWGNLDIRKQAAGYLKAASLTTGDLETAYLKRWAHDGDVNFLRSQGEWGIPII